MTDQQTTRRRLLAGIGAASGIALAGCTDGGGNGDTTEPGMTTTDDGMMTTEPPMTTTEPEPMEGRVRVAHMSPNAPNVDVYLNGNAVLEDVPFGAVSGYLTVPAGDHDVTITPAGAPDTEVFSGTVTIEAETDYTIAATGEIGDMADQPFSPLIFGDDNSDVADGEARLTAVHASPDAPAVDITAADGDVVLFDGVEYGQTGTVTVGAGDYTVQIRGDTDSNDGDVVAEFDVTLEGGEVYTAFAAGYLSPDDEPADTPFDLLVTTPSGRGAPPAPEPSEGRVRVAHMSPNAPNVDVYLDGNAVLEDVPFGAVSGYLTVQEGDHGVTITPAGAPDTEVFSGTVTTAADTDYTIAATGEIGDQADQPFSPLVFEDDNSEVADDEARLEVIHASPDAPAVDVTAAGGDVVLFDGVEYGQGGTVEVGAGTYTVQIRGDTAGNDGDVVAEYEVTLEGGEIYTAFAAGYLTPDDEPGDEPFNLLITTPNGRGAAPEPSGQVRAAHMSPNAPDVDIYVDGDQVLSGVPFGAVSEYLSLPAGDREVEITAAGAPDTVVFSGTVTVEADTAYTISAIGEIGDDADKAFQPFITVDDTSDVPDGKARLTAVHASPDAPAVDITAAGGDVVLFDGVEFGQAGTVEVDAGTYTVQIRGDTASNDGGVVAEYDVTLESGGTYTAFAAGYLTPDDEPGDERFNLLVTTPSGRGAAPEPSGRVRVAHMSPNAPNVDVYLNGDAVLQDVPFGAVSGYLSVSPGERQVEITAAGDADAVVFSGPVPVAVDTDYTIAAIGELGENEGKPFEPLVLEDNNSAVADDEARLRVAHVSPDAPAVDITVPGDHGTAVLFDGVEYGQSGYVTGDAGDYTIQIRGDTASNDGSIVAEYDVTLEGGTVYTAFAAGYLTPDDEPADTPFDLLVAQDSSS